MDDTQSAQNQPQLWRAAIVSHEDWGQTTGKDRPDLRIHPNRLDNDAHDLFDGGHPHPDLLESVVSQRFHAF